MKRLCGLILLIALNALAGDIPTLPVGPTYSAAVGKAQDAFLVQSGIQKDLDHFKAFGESQAKMYAEQLGVAPELGMLLFAAKTYRDRSLSIPVSSKVRMNLHLDQVGLTIRF